MNKGGGKKAIGLKEDDQYKGDNQGRGGKKGDIIQGG
jgi:hypothetical protein